MMDLGKRHWDRIHRYQRDEIEKISADPGFAAVCAKMEHYSKISEWPGAAIGNHILELGCGPGRYVAFLSHMGCHVIGVDPLSYDTWKIVSAYHSVRFISNIFAEDLPFSQDAFDSIACLGAFFYFNDATRALREMRRVLRTGGHLILRTINRKNLFARILKRNIDPASKNLYTMDELISLLNENGFTTIKQFSYGFYPPILEKYWWYLVNGVIPITAQRFLSFLTPPALRVNHIVFAKKQ